MALSDRSELTVRWKDREGESLVSRAKGEQHTFQSRVQPMITQHRALGAPRL